MSTLPIIYIVHGSWHSPIFFDPVKTRLESRGYQVICPQLPSMTGELPAVKTMYDDADPVRRDLENLIEDQGQDVLLVMHSYGGIVGTQAAAGLGKAERRAAAVESQQQQGSSSGGGGGGGVIRLLYVCSFILTEDEHLCQPLGGEPAPFLKIEENGICIPVNPEQVFYQDLPVDEQKYWATQVKPQPLITQFNPMTKVAYKNIPVSYLYCENDQALPCSIQKFFVERCRTTVDVTTFTCTAGHSPFLSQPDFFADLVVKVSAME
ncbi:hypothetical protein H2204_011617 [Knufia peltigerae]|uniref:AB hydrolase-1 domain-containing protein n=1 Tax=Knufia peltigerae TaxID=1002370 RepID=A0AA39CTS2_9EURO|nr:hypothetical protein H2204_011617 [Knufia peltigerae]